MSTVNPPKLYTTKQFAEQIGMSEITVRRWEKQGKLIPCLRTKGNQRRYSEKQVQDYLNNK